VLRTRNGHPKAAAIIITSDTENGFRRTAAAAAKSVPSLRNTSVVVIVFAYFVPLRFKTF